jgi:hypothetical protein
MIVLNILLYISLSILSFYLSSDNARERFYRFLGDTIGSQIQSFFSIMGAIFLFLIIPEIASLV